jgi:large subunit ribosomal protein L10e
MAYTRQEYIASVPSSKIRRFTTGEPDDDYTRKVSLIADTNAQISSKALEAARVTASKALTTARGERAFLLEIDPYPHEIVRTHKFMGFAGADRLSQGMRQSFGRPTARAATVNAGQAVLSLSVKGDDVNAAKTALKRAAKKLPIPYNVTVEPLET